MLTAEKAFLTLSMFNTVRLSMTLFFPFAISQLGEMRVSVNRIQDFLMLEEREERAEEKGWGSQEEKEALLRGEEVKESGPTVALRGVTAKWRKEELEDTLADISMEVEAGQLVAIIGPVGSGKSSVLQAVLGELAASQGSVGVSGQLSYAPQEAWVFGGSVRSNILFGEEYDAKWYAEVIEACALKHDFSAWGHGDLTLVGERGVALSGGQKARVNLARACYRRAATYLLDDPLSAVDAHVGKHLFEHCIQGLLKDKVV